MGLSIAKPKLIVVDNDKTESYLKEIHYMGDDVELVRLFHFTCM